MRFQRQNPTLRENWKKLHFCLIAECIKTHIHAVFRTVIFTGNEYAAALGVIAGKPEKELESLADVTEADNAAAENW